MQENLGLVKLWQIICTSEQHFLQNAGNLQLLEYEQYPLAVQQASIGMNCSLNE